MKTQGVTFTMKLIKLRSKFLPIIILGGSPISVAAPPTFVIMVSPITNGVGSASEISQM